MSRAFAVIIFSIGILFRGAVEDARKRVWSLTSQVRLLGTKNSNLAKLRCSQVLRIPHGTEIDYSYLDYVMTNSRDYCHDPFPAAFELFGEEL